MICIDYNDYLLCYYHTICMQYVSYSSNSYPRDITFLPMVVLLSAKTASCTVIFSIAVSHIRLVLSF